MQSNEQWGRMCQNPNPVHNPSHPEIISISFYLKYYFSALEKGIMTDRSKPSNSTWFLSELDRFISCIQGMVVYLSENQADFNQFPIKNVDSDYIR